MCIFLLFVTEKIDPNFNLSSLGLVSLVSKTKSAFSLRGAINLSSFFIDSSRLFSPGRGWGLLDKLNLLIKISKLHSKNKIMTRDFDNFFQLLISLINFWREKLFDLKSKPMANDFSSKFVEATWGIKWTGTLSSVSNPWSSSIWITVVLPAPDCPITKINSCLLTNSHPLFHFYLILNDKFKKINNVTYRQCIFNCFFTLFMIYQDTVTKCNSQREANLCDAIIMNGSIVKLVQCTKI